MAKMPHSPLSESKANRLQGLNQDVLAVAPPAPLPDTDSTPFISPPRQGPVAMSEGGRSGLLWLSLGLASVAALLVVALWLGQRSANRELSEIRQQYYQLAAELAEQKSSASATPQASAGASANVAASVRDDLRQLSAKVRGLTVAVAKLNSADNSDATVALGKRLDGLGTSVKALSSRVATLSSRSPAQPVAQPVSQQNDSRLSTLQNRVSKIDNDLQALYRILQGG
ncbi:hypothetical protein [Alcanivorax sp.]|jgi:predicted  nucleic acid-binding Zn-ribbon protein|uniref:hypothetical protein n=1 Tax=Alcanivorax sp. TaxID=1872427 RepID=UPI0032D8DC62